MGGPSKGVASLRLLPRRLRVARLRLKEIALVLLAAMCAAVGNSHDSNQVSMISQRCNALFLSIPSHSVEFRTGGAHPGAPDLIRASTLLFRVSLLGRRLHWLRRARRESVQLRSALTTNPRRRVKHLPHDVASGRRQPCGGFR